MGTGKASLGPFELNATASLGPDQQRFRTPKISERLGLMFGLKAAASLGPYQQRFRAQNSGQRLGLAYLLTYLLAYLLTI